MSGEATLGEIAEQFDVWKGLLDDIELLQSDVNHNFGVKEYDDVIFVGAGSSYHLASAAASEFRRTTGEMAYSFPASEVIYFCDYLIKKERKYIAVFFSRSGRTPETIQAMETLRANFRCITVAVSCDPTGPICKHCDIAFPVKNCVEQSIIMTKSFTSMLMVSYMFSMALGEKFTYANYLEQLSEEGKAAFEMQRRIIDRVVAEEPLNKITILGGGPFYALAKESGLKLDEMAFLRSQVLSPNELRHGPIAGVNGSDLIIMFMSDSAKILELRILREAKSLGARTVVFSDRKEAEFDSFADHLMLTGRGLPEQYRGILYIPFIQYMAAKTAIAMGIDPDNPPNLTRVVTY
ncbi:MAG TPA: SIS domain-containing protein [bacterium]|nr:SIS domain-containing protein [bacterium]